MENNYDNMAFQGETSKKRLKASKIATDFQKNYVMEVQDRASQGEPFIWTNVGVPQEIMHAMGIPILFNPYWSAIIAAKQMAKKYLDVLNERGYFRDLCRYCAMPLGYFYDTNPGEGPWGGVPKPTAIVVDTMDDPIVRIFELMAKKFDVPLYIWDRTMIAAPPHPSDSFCETVEDIEAESYKEPWRIDYGIKETEGLIAFLETVTGKSLSESKLREVMERSNEQFDYVGKTMDLCANVPSPIGMGDHLANLLGTQFFRGHEFGLAQAKRVYEEVKDRVDKGLVACENERVRLGYLLVPNWYTPGFYDSFEEKYGAVFVWMMYFTIARQLIRRDLSDPIRALSARYILYAELGQPPWWPQWVVHYAKKFKLNGAVYQIAESCRLLSAATYHCVKALQDIGIPTYLIRGDMVDVRDWDDVKMKAQVGNFIETLL
jgi:benzoyl-CoA reductase/2-hydroxyglutaryl-CoA dehydratase subunit BcrC/BadD/HgdB